MSSCHRSIVALVAALGGAACGDDGGDGAAQVDAAPAADSAILVSCADLAGAWLLRSWTCDGVATDVAGLGVELVRDFSTATAGTSTTRLFTPPGQNTVWVARTHGVVASFQAGTLALTTAAPAELCSTNLASGVDWGPVATGVGTQSCQNRTGAPGTPATSTYTCAVVGETLAISQASLGDDGPCAAGQQSVETWARR